MARHLERRSTGPGLTCHPPVCRHVVTINGFEDVPKNDAAALKKAIAHQPVSVAICASMSLQLYHSGVVGDDACCQDLNHGVLAVGYDDGSKGGIPHYVIKVWRGCARVLALRGATAVVPAFRRCACAARLLSGRCCMHGLPRACLQNSWGEGWGEDGFFRLAAKSSEASGACGVYKAASYPLKKDSTNPAVPSFCGYFGWTECPASSQCVCNFDFLGLVCFAWGCETNASA